MLIKLNPSNRTIFATEKCVGWIHVKNMEEEYITVDMMSRNSNDCKGQSHSSQKTKENNVVNNILYTYSCMYEFVYVYICVTMCVCVYVRPCCSCVPIL